jgi:Cu-Zn family superoxide dismutase
VTAQLRNAGGQVVGVGIFTDASPGVRMNLQVRGLPPGIHGVHVHTNGSCIAPDFDSAGAHFNPTTRQHGLENPSGPHVGDLPNLQVDTDGSGQLTALNPDLTLDSAANSVFDADGSSLVIHANPDDNVTDPSGNSGARLACGTITRG